MKLKTITVFAVLLCSITAFGAGKTTAKTSSRDSNIRTGAMWVGGDLGLYKPIGDFGKWADFGVGIEPNFNYVVMNNFAVQGSIGFIYWSTKSVPGSEVTAYSIPFKGGAKYFIRSKIGGGIQPYVLGELGLHYMAVDSTLTFDDGFGNQTKTSGSTSNTDPCIGLWVGGLYAIDSKISLDFKIGIDMVFADETATDIALKIGANYRL